MCSCIWSGNSYEYERRKLLVLPTDIQVAFITGAVFVDMGRKYITSQQKVSPERAELVYNRFRHMGILYAATVLTPVIATFFNAWPGWESQYWTSITEQLKGCGVLSLLADLYFLLMTGAGYFGVWLSFRLLADGRGGWIRPIYIISGVITMALFLGRWPAPVKLGSVFQFQENPWALPYVWENLEFMVLFCLLLLYCIVSYVVVFVRYAVKKSK